MKSRGRSGGLTKGDAKKECAVCGQRDKVKDMVKIDEKYYHKECVDEE